MSHECGSGCTTHQSHGHSSANCDCCCHRHCDCPCHDHHQKYSDQLLELADEAWMEVVKEAIKEEIRQHSGAHIKELAQLVSKANHIRWTERIAGKKTVDDFDAQLRHLISSHHIS